MSSRPGLTVDAWSGERAMSAAADAVSATAWSGHERATALYELRPRLIAQLPRRIAAARALDPHRREEVVDDAAEWAAYVSPHPVFSHAELEALAWDALHKRVLRALEGRYDTVRPDRRAAETELAVIAAGVESDPAALAEGREEMRLVLEFIRQLAPGIDRDVFWVRHTAEGRSSAVLGYAKIAARLSRPEREVRSALRRVQIELTAYQRRVSDADTFTQKALLALPAPVLADPRSRPSGWRETLLDWLSRPFGHDTAATASTLAASGGGRGIGTLAVAICLGGTAAGGGYCVVTGTVPFPPDPPKPTEPRRAARAQPPADASRSARALLAAQRQAADSAARERAAARERTAARRASRRAVSRRAQATPVPGSAADQREIRQDTREAEQAPASPAARSSSGNDFDFEQTGPTQSAAPAAAPRTGGGEFLP